METSPSPQHQLLQLTHRKLQHQLSNHLLPSNNQLPNRKQYQLLLNHLDISSKSQPYNQRSSHVLKS
ncbi:unnamed protein product [Strongylus vulgaris]|uniref:Uncharacterized protein n=1 Tax=Strongylus vulgaris TaxID=40348 RepID=A0A3P7JKL5_STRVU|nr:unnamed protein product [Strongylus vulgaris]